MIFKLEPAGMAYLWGGTTLINEFGKKSEGGTLAETWELSCHKKGLSVIRGTKYDGCTLSDYLSKHPEEMGSIPGKFPEFPVLIKLIDAKKNFRYKYIPVMHMHIKMKISRERQRCGTLLRRNQMQACITV
ncbi:type I phosphomannose isomerase catalytic subunit [Novisyntrophococcus fermenticellae]|uniref:type I phosphomannose isomerase catalytic subunit n=1 Tax=Novisyntrophococcus fermenticellae TaxID=2068655 RepID=UPI001E4405FF|nr:type I phosphomannose isomerase catalytic subunit [Novisyntrophococcus fermenticellae]